MFEYNIIMLLLLGYYCYVIATRLLFNIYIEELVREAVEDLEEGIKVGGR